MVGNYKVITLCGSTRFKDEFMEINKKLTLAGNIVISVGLFGHSGDNEVWENMDAQKAHTQTPHFKALGEIKGEYVQNTVLKFFDGAVQIN